MEKQKEGEFYEVNDLPDDTQELMRSALGMLQDEELIAKFDDMLRNGLMAEGGFLAEWSKKLEAEYPDKKGLASLITVALTIGALSEVVALSVSDGGMEATIFAAKLLEMCQQRFLAKAVLDAANGTAFSAKPSVH